MPMLEYPVAALNASRASRFERRGKNKVYRLNSDLVPILSGIEKHLAHFASALDSCEVLELESKPLVLVRKISPAAPPKTRRRT